MTLTTDQLEVVRKGEPVRFTEAGDEFVVLRADLFEKLTELSEEEEDRKIQEAFLHASHESAVAHMKENPY